MITNLPQLAKNQEGKPYTILLQLPQRQDHQTQKVKVVLMTQEACLALNLNGIEDIVALQDHRLETMQALKARRCFLVTWHSLVQQRQSPE